MIRIEKLSKDNFRFDSPDGERVAPKPLDLQLRCRV